MPLQKLNREAFEVRDGKTFRLWKARNLQEALSLIRHGRGSIARAQCLAIGLTFALTTSGHAEETRVEYGPNDVATIVATYKRDQARFDKDYSGKIFVGIMLFRSAQSSFVGGYYISLGSGDVLCEYVRASDIEYASHWNRGDPIQVKGTIDDVTQGILTLKGCSFLKPLQSK